MLKTALITGASRGLGKAIADVFSTNGYGLILHCKERPPRLGNWVCGDLRSKDTITNLTKAAQERDIDVLVNNAGIYLDQPFWETSEKEFKKMLDINLLAPILLTKAIWPIFQKKKSGIVMNINSIAGKVASNGESAYCASKYGLRGFSDSIKFDAIRDNIHVLDVYPHAMKTDMMRYRKNYESLPESTKIAQAVFECCR